MTDPISASPIPDPSPDSPLGVVVVTYNSADVILDCLESLIASQGVRLAIVVVDNDSTDGTLDVLKAWSSGEVPYSPPDDLPFPLIPAPGTPASELRRLRNPATEQPLPEAGHGITLIETGENGGFAAGVNRGLAHLATHPGIDRFWILNPDSVVPPDTGRAFAMEAGPAFALMGGRVLYLECPDRIQIDGGTIDRRTGVTGNIGLGQVHATTPLPDPSTLDFMTGASMVASRAFYEAVGPMREDYFLYYEEVDWALRRGAMPLAYCSGGIVYHRAGTAIGSPAPGRPASPFSLYFKHRGRIRFVRRHLPFSLPSAWAYSLAKAMQLRYRGHATEARAVLAGSRNRPPPPEVRARLSPGALRRLGA